MIRPKINLQPWVCGFIVCWFIGGAASLRAAEPGLIEKARAEGELVLYTAWGLDTVQALQKAFAKKYPFIKVDVLRTGSERLLNVTTSEHKQKLFRADVFSGSHLAMINHTKVGHLQKYVSAEQRAFPKEYKDPDGYWTAFYMDTRVLAYNTKMAVRDELPKSYDELLLPKWKGKMGMDNADYILYGTLQEMMGRERGSAFLKKLAQQDLIIRSGHPILTQLLIGGEFPVYYGRLRQHHRAIQGAGRADRLGGAGTGDRFAEPTGNGGQRAASGVGKIVDRLSLVQRRARCRQDRGQAAGARRCRSAVSTLDERAEALSGAECGGRALRRNRQRLSRDVFEINGGRMMSQKFV